MFIGRKEEIKIIKEVADGSGKCLMLYGKRKIGKTTLLKESLKDSKNITIYYECVKSSLRENVDNFVYRLVEEKIFPVQINFNSFDNVFAYLNTLNGNFNIIIDEYPYLKKFERSETVDSLFQNIIDNQLKNINLFISGSHVGMMKDLLEEKNALFGRFSIIIKLNELNYVESANFYSNKSVYDKIGFYSIFGGSPFVNTCIDKDKTLKENVVNTVLNPTNAISNYAEHLLMSDLTSSIHAERILHVIGNGKKKHKDIESKLGFEKNGLLSKYLNVMLDMGLISKVYPINADNDNKKAYYELNDNLLRFYYTYVYNNKSQLEILGADSFYDEYIEPSLITFISHRFEEICRSYFSLLIKTKKLAGILNVGTYYFDDSKNRINGEFDIALKKRNGYEIFESKYYKDELKKREMLEEETQINQIKSINVVKMGFISVSGFEEKIDRFEYFDGEDLYFLK